MRPGRPELPLCTYDRCSRFVELVGLHVLLQLQQPLAICGGHDVARHKMVPAVVITTRLPPRCALIRLQGHCVPGKDGATRTIELASLAPTITRHLFCIGSSRANPFKHDLRPPGTAFAET
eukprot:scaffold12118_cov75-Phaeocystis_antarctica.AAC.1